MACLSRIMYKQINLSGEQLIRFGCDLHNIDYYIYDGKIINRKRKIKFITESAIPPEPQIIVVPVEEAEIIEETKIEMKKSNVVNTTLIIGG